jgi:hypothetical protein
VKWELDWLLKMQDGASGGFYHLVYPNNCPASGSCRPEDIAEQRYIEDVMGRRAQRASDRVDHKGGRRTGARRGHLRCLRWRAGGFVPRRRGGWLGISQGESAEHSCHRVQRRTTWTNQHGNAGDVVMRAFLAYNGSVFADPRERKWFRTRFAGWRATQMARTAST